MQNPKKLKTPSTVALVAMLTVGSFVTSSDTFATTLNAPASGTFTMNLDRTALQPYFGYFLSSFWDGAASDINNPAHTGGYFSSNTATTEISAVNRVFELTAIGNNPLNQPGQRFVKATSADFSIDSDTLAGIAGSQIGMTGVQGFYAQGWPPSGGGIVNGDFSITYDASRQSTGQTGWYLANNIYFSMAVYDLSNLNLSFTDANNWQLSGDLLMSPENGGMLQGASLNDVGNFCLGVGSHAGCGQVSTVPIPAAIWLFGGGLVGLIGVTSKNHRSKTI